MTEKIKEYKSKLESVIIDIRNDIEKYLKDIDYSQTSNQFQIIELSSQKDLEKVIYGQGFYIILTDHVFTENTCEFKYKNQVAIYRGHSYFSKKRISSHLSNKSYQTNRSKNDPNYTVCLKIDDKVNGINIDLEPYNNWKWTVIIHKMKNSNKTIREQAEKAFDDLYNKPCKSRD